ncbi:MULTISPECIES: hypothetical protein [Mycobacterium avium complex (MAC)]|uniref:hypothetical protein n=1 Tax=Mycobacterium avium complex (MAC) TaxID=120793 RepID=UPI00111C245B|nr:MULTISPECIES: hypothetical protein [Mycobacterium avium complex (MAC)]MCV7406706.1 hypothetical protein [Mycobacterium marseillense]
MNAYDVVLQLAKEVARELSARSGPPEVQGWFIHTLHESRWDDPEPAVPGHPAEWQSETRRLFLKADGELQVHREAFQQDFNEPLKEWSDVRPVTASELAALDENDKPFTFITNKLEQARWRGR